MLPRRLYQGAGGAQYRHFPHKLPIALDGERATLVFVQAEDETERAVCTWGSQYAALWLALAAAGRAVEVAQLPQSANRLQPAEDLLDQLPLPLTDLVTGMPGGSRPTRTRRRRGRSCGPRSPR